MSSKKCIAAITEAARGILTDEEIDAVFTKAQTIRKRLEAEGKLDNLNQRVAEAMEREAEKTKIAAALQRRHAAMNALVRERAMNQLDRLMAGGIPAEKALLAMLEGSQRAVEGARKSVYATRQAYETRFLGGLVAELETETPYVKRLANDKAFNDDVVREMTELKEGGRPGVTGNADAVKVAQIFARHAEASRVELNRLGAAIGKLDGWGGPHRHDPLKIARVSEDDWLAAIKPRLDFDRTFDGADPSEYDDILRSIYKTIVTGQGEGINAQRTGEFVGPANLAKSLAKSRVLHFRDADAWIAYNDEFGSGTLLAGMVSHQQRAAAHAAQMEVFGPNPELMLDSLADTLREKLRNDPTLPNATKEARIRELNFGRGGGSQTRLAQAFLEMQGLTMSPVNITAAQIGQGIRAQQMLAKLGGAVVTAVPSDTMTVALASQFRGGGFLRGLTAAMDQLLQGHGRGAAGRREITFLLGEGFDGLIANFASPHFANDGMPGKITTITNAFFKYSGLTGWTDRIRGAAGRIISAEMGMRAASRYDQLPEAYRHVLKLQGITPEKWDVIRQVDFRADNGTRYITPDLVRKLPDDALMPLIADRMAAYIGKNPAAAQARYLDDARRELELDLARFFADETNYGVIETDAASRRWAVRGTRPGTFAGEALRFVMQFKGFPLAFTQRVGGRALLGGRNRQATAIHVGTIMAALTAAGYMSQVASDTLKGRWPPRDPSDPEVVAAAMLRGGALGIYGDFLFGQVNRFGNTTLETAAGPAAATAAQIGNVFRAAMRGEASAGEALNLALNNTPFLNLWYARPAAEALFLSSVKEWASPGYRRRTEQRLREDYGQELLY
ncbi:hypothetical protein [Pannonibacter tanglangensis]|uniref:Uncharacterized protein n=1 Tax=Pannonibacter tanglangensis TaxID=2750084 RepID=A0ABW9ZJA5_9HYPH|nr:hypothetical protein [Pannonibacter sp. XCT-34]NBN64123.1 hypothetical protein [Pannonibacter sp. XCT-34]